jgi:hypothetical protein
MSGFYVAGHGPGCGLHHLAFTQKDVDWQIWSRTATCLPRKLVFVDKTMASAPNYVALIVEGRSIPG